MSAAPDRAAVITGIGLVTALAEGVEAHLRALTGNAPPAPRIDAETCAPYPYHPLVAVDLGLQIPKRGDQRQMEDWQRYGTYAAGLALEDAGLAGNEAVLSQAGLIVAAGGGERDCAADIAVLEGLDSADNPGAFMNERLLSDLRPTLFLAQLSNLLAGNISIVHHVTGSSRTFMGEEISGAMALQTAMRQIHADQGDVFLVGGSYNAARPDMMLLFDMAGHLVRGDGVAPVWSRDASTGGGLVFGSMGAFLVLEARAHAQARGARIYARLDEVMAERGRRDDEEAVLARVAPQAERLAALAGDGPLGLLSGASGALAARALECRFIDSVAATRETMVRGCATAFGHGLEAQMPACVALAAMALHAGQYFPPFDAGGYERPASAMPATIAVTGWGHWRGEALAVVGRDGQS